MTKVAWALSLLFLIVITHSASACPTSAVTISGNFDSNSLSFVPSFANTSLADLKSQAIVSTDFLVYDATHVPVTASALVFRQNELHFVVALFTDSGALAGSSPGVATLIGNTVLNVSGDSVVSPAQPILVVVGLGWNSSSRSTGFNVTSGAITFLPSASVLNVSADGSATACGFGAGILDFDGDGIDDFAVWRPDSATWYVNFTAFKERNVLVRQWGLPGDIPIAGNFTGDKLADFAVWRPSTGVWYICRSEANWDCSNAPQVTQFGLPTDIPIKADANGDQRLDLIVWRPSEGNFYVRNVSTGAALVTQWGLPLDVPLQAGLKR